MDDAVRHLLAAFDTKENVVVYLSEADIWTAEVEEASCFVSLRAASTHLRAVMLADSPGIVWPHAITLEAILLEDSDQAAERDAGSDGEESSGEDNGSRNALFTGIYG